MMTPVQVLLMLYTIVALFGALITTALSSADDPKFTLRHGAKVVAAWFVWPLVLVFLLLRGLSDLVDDTFFPKKGAK